MLAFRSCNHSEQNTTSAIEGYHGALKLLDLNSERKRLVGRRLDWLIAVLLFTTEPRYRTQSEQLKRKGFVPNIKAEAAVEASIKASREVAEERVLMQRESSQPVTDRAAVSSPNWAPGYVVTGALTAQPRCSCPAGMKGSICKHMVKVMLMLGKTEREVLKVWGTLRGTAPGDALLTGHRWTGAAAPEAEHSGAEQAGGSAEQGGGAVHPLRRRGGTSSTALQVLPSSQQRQLAAPSASECRAPVCRVDLLKAVKAIHAAMLAKLEGESATSSVMQAAVAESRKALSAVSVLQARTNTAMFPAAAAPAALEPNAAAPVGMGLGRLPSRIEGKRRGGGRGKSKQALQLGMDGGQAAVEGTKRARPLQGLRQTGPKKPRSLAELAARKLAVKDSSSQPLLLLCAPPPASHRELLQQAAQQPAAGGYLEALLHDVSQ